MSDGILETVKMVGGAMVLIFIVTFILATILGTVSFGSVVDVQFEPSTEEYEELGDAESIESLEVRATSESAVATAGEEGSYLEAPGGVDPATNWTIATTTWLDEPDVQDSWLDVIATDGGNVTLQYGAGEWVGYYADPTSDQTASVRIDATDPTSQTSLVLRWDGSELWLSNGDQTATSTLDSNTEQRNVSWPWDGRIDEVRLLNASLSDAQAQTYIGDPVDPLDPSEHTARLMLDEGGGSSSTVYYNADDAQLVGSAEWADGVADPGLEPDVDYELELDPIRFRAVADGYLDGAPVVYVESTGFGSVWGEAVNRMVNIGATALLLLVVALLAIAAAVVNREFGGFGGGGR